MDNDTRHYWEKLIKAVEDNTAAQRATGKTQADLVSNIRSMFYVVMVLLIAYGILH